MLRPGGDLLVQSCWSRQCCRSTRCCGRGCGAKVSCL